MKTIRPVPLLVILTLFLFGCDAESTLVEAPVPEAPLARLAKGGGPQGSIGYVVGFSNTRGTAIATERIGYGASFAPADIVRAGGGQTKIFIEPKRNHDRHVENAVASQASYADDRNLSPRFIYWMIGLRKQRTPGSSLDQKHQALALLDAILQESGGAPVLINAMSAYDGHVCSGSGAYGPAVAEELLDYLEAAAPGAFIRIARFPALKRAETTDGCHPTEAIYERDAQLLMDEVNRVL